MTTTWEHPEEEENAAQGQQVSDNQRLSCPAFFDRNSSLQQAVLLGTNDQQWQQQAVLLGTNDQQAVLLGTNDQQAVLLGTNDQQWQQQVNNLPQGGQYNGVGGGLRGQQEMPRRGFCSNAPSQLGDPFGSLDLGRGPEPASSPAGSIWSSAPLGGNSLDHSGALTVKIGDLVLPASETSSYHTFEASKNAGSALLHYNNAFLPTGGGAAVPAVGLNPNHATRHSVRATTSSPALQPPGSSTAASAAPLSSHFPVVRAVSGSEADGHGSFSRKHPVSTDTGQPNTHPLMQEQEPAQQMQHAAMQFGQLW